MSLDATAGGVSANAYCTVAEADDYNDLFPSDTSWNGTTAVKEANIKLATLWLDQRITWYGRVETLTQSLRVPRAEWVDRDSYSVAVATVPVDIKYATAELAMRIHDGTVGSLNTLGAGLKSTKVEGVDVVFDHTDTSGLLPNHIKVMLSHWGFVGNVSAGVSAVKVSRS
ncbi:MAG: hypothetical protein HN802_04845 [Candidatus Jacksonbacteria bacterium]|nr:hypothetical protein [Candidatus Jacksonbacteria bacterium]